MTKTRFAKAVAVVAGLAMSLGAVVPAGAVTVADLQAQIAALMAQLQALQGGSSATVSVTFTRDLTVGSTGSDVTALQQILVQGGYLTMPHGVAYGYFGRATKAALARWQAATGISPASGYFGPKSRAALSTSAGTTTGGTTTGGTTTGGTTASGTISTPGAEGTITVTAAPISNATLYVNDQKDPVAAFNVKANGSDVAVQRVKVDLGTNTNLYNQVFNNLYVVDDSGKVLGSLSMNSTNVTKDSDGHFYATITGFSSVVPKGTQRTYQVAADIRSSVDSTYRTSYTVNIPINGVRAVDGAGIDLYGPATAIGSTITINQSLAQSAQLTVSTDPATPAAQLVIANNGAANNQYDKLPVLVFDIRADKDNVKLTDLNNVTITSTGGTGATASTSYLYVGNGTSGQLLGTAALTGSTANFNNMSYVIPAGTTQTFTLAADIRSANTSATTFTASLTGNTTNVVGTNSNGDTVTNVSGSASGNGILVRSNGPVITLVGTPTITKSATAAQNNTSTSTATAVFNVNLKAVGADLYFGTQAASSTFQFATYVGGVKTTLLVASTTSWSTPTSGVVTAGMTGANAFKLQQNNSVTIPVTFYFEGRTTAGALVSGGTYAVGLEAVNWSTTGNDTQTTNFMAGNTSWRTAEVLMP